MRAIPTVAALVVVNLLEATAVAGGPAIDVEQLRRDVGQLSGDSYRGREAGQPGSELAELYVARRFEQLGLSPLPGQDDYWLDFDLFRSGVDPERTTLTLQFGEAERVAELGRAFRPFPFSDEGSLRAPLVFVGYGISADAYDHDDYAGLDVKGKLVLVLRHEPGELDPDSSFDGLRSTEHATFAAKAENARRHGARGMLLVTDPLHHPPADDLRVRTGLRLEAERTPPREAEPAESFLAAQISQPLARELVQSAGHDLEAMQRAVDGGAKPSEFPLPGIEAALTVTIASEAERVPARNVAAFIEGSDPRLRDEWILVGGHHDHIGGFDGEGDTIFNGADDNASGTSGVLALARSFAMREPRPRRSMLFVTFAAEEKGLLGSRAMLGQRQIPLEKLRFMFNLDMIGRNPQQEVQLYGDGYASGLRAIVERANRDSALPISFGGDEYFGNSDHDPFYDAGIPFMFFFTGVHEDYHQLGDHADKLDYERMRSILEVGAAILASLADADSMPSFVHHVNWLGLKVEARGADAVVSAVDGDSRAAEAGIVVGDVVRAIDDLSLAESAAVGKLFAGIEPGQRARLTLARGDESHQVKVERAQVGYMGIVPSAVGVEQRETLALAEDEGILLSQVVPDGPSDRAGLRAGDILIRIDGRAIGPATLGARMQQIGAGERVEATVIRGDERKTITVKLGRRPDRRR